MEFLGKDIVLGGISQKGKNRIRELGHRWTVLAQTDRVLFAPNQLGPWLFVTPRGRGQDDNASRWVHLMDDADFTVVVDD